MDNFFYKKNYDKLINGVSVIIPAYNAGYCIGTCIDSVVAQSLKPIEIIVIDDGSTDNTVQVIESYKYLVTLIQQENSGSAVARNKGLEIAKGEFIAFLDADDYWYPDFLFNAVIAMNENKNALALLTSWHKTLHNGEKILVPNIANQIPENECRVIDDLFKFYVDHGNIQTGAILLRTYLIRNIGYMNTALRTSQDLEYWFLISCYGEWCFLNKALYVNDSRRAAIDVGWRKKYYLRRKYVPTVEEWERRLINIVPEKSIIYFEKIKGSIALSYAYDKLLGKDLSGAERIIENYAKYFPSNKVSALIIIFSKFGPIGIICISTIFRCRELLKDWYLSSKVLLLGK